MVGKSVGNELKVGPLCLHGHLQGELFQACPPGRRPEHTGGLVPLGDGLVSPKNSWRKWLSGRWMHLDANEEKVEADAQKYAGNDVCDLRASV